MKSLSEKQCNLFGIPSEYKNLVEIADCRFRKGPDGSDDTDTDPYLVLLRTKKGYRDYWINGIIKKNPSIKSSPSELRCLEESFCPVDMYDSGIIYHITKDIDGVEVAQIVCRTDDFPSQQVVDKQLIDRLFLEDDTDLREWKEGTIVRIFTLPGDGVNPPETFYGTRGKIDCINSRCVQTKDCPTIREMFNEAIKIAGINTQSLEIENICFAFIVVNEWNQLRKTAPKQPELVLFRVYAFGEGRYLELSDPHVQEDISKEIPVMLPKLTPEQSREIILNGGVVITNSAHKNTKFMTEQTAKEYSWFQNSSNPAMTYYDLKSSSCPEDAQKFHSMLNGWNKDFLENALKNHDTEVAEAIEYILERHLLFLRAPEGERSLEQNQGIAKIMTQIRCEHFIAKSEAEKIENDEKSSKKNTKKKFVWGGSHTGNLVKCREVIRRELTKLEKENGLLFYNVITKCHKFKESENYRKNKEKAVLAANNVTTPRSEQTKPQKLNANSARYERNNKKF